MKKPVVLFVLLVVLAVLAMLFVLRDMASASGGESSSYDVIVVGAGTGGVAAAISAAREDASVLLIEETDWVGGQATAAGVSTMDGGKDIQQKQPEGIYAEFIGKIEAHYQSIGKSIHTCYWGDDEICFEPHIGQAIMRQMLTEAGVTLLERTIVTGVLFDSDGAISGVQTDRGDFYALSLIEATEYGDVLELLPDSYMIGEQVQDVTWTAIVKYYPDGVPDDLIIKTAPPGYEQDVEKFRSYVTVDPAFWDVPVDHWTAAWIEQLARDKITIGCGDKMYCPDSYIFRAQMAIFLERMLHGSDYAPPPAVGLFEDVPDNWVADWVEALFADGITLGCSIDPPRYCPNARVTRAEMAIFLGRAIRGTSYVPPAPIGRFDDVPIDYWAAAWIEQLARDGITLGCSATKFCPTKLVTRAQMAVFLERAMHWPEPYKPPVATGGYSDWPVIKYPVSWTFHNAYRGIPDSSTSGDLITKTGINWANDWAITPSAILDRDERHDQMCRAKLHTLNFIYYMQTEIDSRWAIANDEGYDTEYNRQNRCLPDEYEAIEIHFPLIPYVREARRMIGIHVLLASEIRYVLFDDAVAWGDYPIDFHGGRGSLDFGETWDMVDYSVTGIFDIPAGSLISSLYPGLFATEKNISVSRLVNGATRLQPVTMSTGEAAGKLAAAWAESLETGGY
ncbi:MAG: FAD-dependent oxidoreductase [Anaerolineales bacterium]|nr:MAG: FAD-dependent oxidoreductase [Anaerolineales bacterium]